MNRRRERFTYTPAATVAAQPWRNGGGRTRELLAWPDARNWTLRVSLADIDADGPFSAFPGVVRWFAVVEGAGVALAFAAGERRVIAGDAPIAFDGALAPHCRLLDGPTRDLNLMARFGRGAMRKVEPDTAWNEPFALRGLFANVAGQWSANGETISVAARTLLWTDAADDVPSAWHFVADADGAASGWWLGFTPQEILS